MAEIKNINSFGHYDRFIQTNLVNLVTDDHCGFDLTKLGPKIADTVIKVNLVGPAFVDEELLKSEAKIFADFIQKQYKYPDERPLWYKINVLDQALNEYIGIGHLNLDADWLKIYHHLSRP